MAGPISAIQPVSIPELSRPTASPASQPGAFQNVFDNVIGGIEQARNDAAGKIEGFVSGENEEVHTAVLATQKAELTFELGLQVRNKVVQAYQEIMKMQL